MYISSIAITALVSYLLTNRDNGDIWTDGVPDPKVLSAVKCDRWSVGVSVSESLL